MLKRLSLFSLFCATCAVGQVATSPNSITVTATRAPNVQPDQAVFAVYVDSSLTTAREDVIAALQGSGIGLANFLGVSTLQQYQLVISTGSTLPQPSLEWVFGVVVPMSSVKTETAALTGLQQSFVSSKSPLSLSFSLQGTAYSQQLLQAQNCSQTDLMSDARAQAQKIAGAASMPVGAVLAAASSVNTASPGALSASGRSVYSSATPAGCSLTVKFALGAGF